MRSPLSLSRRALALAPAVALQTLLFSDSFVRSWLSARHTEDFQALEQLDSVDHLEKRQVVTAGGITFNTINTCLVARWGAGNDLLLYRAYTESNASGTIEGCGQTCGAAKFSVFGVTNGGACSCDHFPHFILPADPSSCTMPCKGNNAQMCGSSTAFAVYQRTDILTVQPTFIDSLNYRHTTGGCFRDFANPSAFGLRVVAVSNTMTPSLCASTCTSLGYVYSATRLGNTCGCTSSIPSSKYLNGMMTNTDNFDQCNTPCTGNSTLVCGGPSTVFPQWVFMDSVYVGTPTYTDANGYKVVSQGCFADSQSSRTLPAQPNIAITGNMTVNACGLACSASGYQMFGVEYGSECYCGPLLSTVNFTTSTSCNMACSGNSGQTCGGPSALSIYTQSIPGTVPTLQSSYNGINYAGCYEWNPSVGTFATIIDLVNGAGNVEPCADACMAAGYAFSGIAVRAYRGQCVCSMSASTFVGRLSDTACNATCPTNSMEFCGSMYASQTTAALTVYNNNVVGLVPAAKALISSYVTAGLTFAYTGCYVDSVSARLFPVKYDVAGLTPQKCMDKCAASGYQLAGVEAGAECYCSNTPMTNSNTKWPLLSGNWVSFTGSSSTYQNQQTACIRACSGDSTLSCGGNNALQVYTAPFAISFTGSTYRGETINYVGCYVDNSTNSPANRALSTNVLISNTMTIQTCVNTCVAKGFAYSGLEYGVECWCQNSAPTTSTVSGNQCNMPCSGASSTMCGAGNLLSVFTITTPSTPQVVNSFLSVTYLGCYATSTSARVLNNYRVVASNMAPGLCASTCTGLGYAYAAVGLANECTCGQQILAGASTSTACTAACQDIASRICGGTNAVSMYSTGAAGLPISSNLLTSGSTSTADIAAQGNVFPSAYSTGSQFSSCVVDSAASRVFTSRVTNINAAAMTPQLCIDACILQGATYAGIEYGVECYCANAAPSASSAPDCVQMACPGNAALGCGAGNRLAVYKIGTVNAGVTVTSTVGGYTSQGCMVDSINSRTLRYFQSLSFNTMTPTICINACAAKNYAYAGLEYSGECYCDVSPTTTTTSTGCTMPCNGLTSAFCGGGNAINVYYNSALVRTGSIASYTAANGNVWRYKACWGEPANGRGLTKPFDNSAKFTIQSCLDAGSAAGLNACGLEYGGECWCDSISGNPGGGQIPESYCTTNGMACKGDATHNCGAANVFAFYSTGSQSYTLM